MYNFRLVQQPLLRTLFVRDIFSLDRNSKKKAGTTCGNLLSN